MSALLVTALLLGAAHSFAPDHLAAIGVFVSRRPHWRRALVIGARWGVGHSLVIVMVGGALVLTGWRFPAAIAPWVERLVGLTLIAVWSLASRDHATRISTELCRPSLSLLPGMSNSYRQKVMQ